MRVEYGFISVKIFSRSFIADEITADTGRSRCDEFVIAEKLERRVAAET